MNRLIETRSLIGWCRTSQAQAQMLARRLGRLLGSWHDRIKQRRALRRLDDHLLQDIGVTREDAKREASQPFWR